MKRIIAAAAAALMVFNTAACAAEGRYLREPEPFDGGAVAYEPYDIKDFEKLTDEAKKLFGKKDSESRLEELFGRIYDEFIKAQYANTTARLMSDRYYSAESNTSAEAAKTAIDAAEELTGLVKYAYENGYTEFICGILDMDEDEVRELIDTMPSER
ncbi:MAG: hypothetical protein IJH94_05685, partial [Clostridia bacterium]|nr:hypothetical protein [Clostridia bacterium]